MAIKSYSVTSSWGYAVIIQRLRRIRELWRLRRNHSWSDSVVKEQYVIQDYNVTTPKDYDISGNHKELRRNKHHNYAVGNING